MNCPFELLQFIHWASGSCVGPRSSTHRGRRRTDMWATRVLRMAVRKTSTGIVGLPVNPNARNDLIAIYQKTLKEVQVLPDGIAYRSAVEKITNYRLKVVLDNEDEDVIEKEINCGQLEELIEQAEDELSVIPVYLENKLWEPPVQSA